MPPHEGCETPRFSREIQGVKFLAQNTTWRLFFVADGGSLYHPYRVNVPWSLYWIPASDSAAGTVAFDWKAITSSVAAATLPSIRSKGQDDDVSLVSSLPSPPLLASGNSIPGVE